METTLAGKHALNVMKDAKQFGFDVELIYIGTNDVSINISRVGARVAQGGHRVPENDIRRRYPRSLLGLRQAMPLADRVVLFDNSYDVPILVLSIEGTRREQFADLPVWAAEL